MIELYLKNLKQQNQKGSFIAVAEVHLLIEGVDEQEAADAIKRYFI